MNRCTLAASSIAAVLACAQPSLAAPAQGPVCVENASLTELREALLSGRTTATALTQAYLARIAAYDRAGPQLNAVRELNPDALAIAQKLDEGRPDPRLPLWGIPILIKDNIATGDKQHTTAGSLALAGARARRDATVVTQLRRAGAVILGKTNLTEFANILALEHAVGLQLARRPGAQSLRAGAERGGHSATCCRADRVRVRRSPLRRDWPRSQSAPRRRARCCRPPTRTDSSR